MAQQEQGQQVSESPSKRAGREFPKFLRFMHAKLEGKLGVKQNSDGSYEVYNGKDQIGYLTVDENKKTYNGFLPGVKVRRSDKHLWEPEDPQKRKLEIDLSIGNPTELVYDTLRNTRTDEWREVPFP